jgi:cytoskeletal protein CcmA (bactofilin family)
MVDYAIRRGESAKLDKVEGELMVGRKARIKSSNGNVVVSGGAHFDGGAEISSSFECEYLEVKHGGTLKIDGDLFVHKLMDVAQVVDVNGKINAGEIDVGGKVFADSISCSGRVRVGGILDVKNALDAQSVDVAGKVACGGRANLQDLSVGGAAIINGGGTILGEIRIQGKFEAKNSLEFGNLEVLGHISLPKNSKGRKISAYGKLVAEGDLFCDEIVIKGVLQVKGNCKAQKIESSGKIEALGFLDADNLSSWGTSDVEGQVRGTTLFIGGKFRARNVIAKDRIEIRGNAETKEGMKAAVVQIASGSSCSGVLVGESVDIGKSYGIVTDWTKHFAGQTASLRLIGRETRVGDVYSSGKVHVGKSARCGKIFAANVELEEGAIVEQVTYTKELQCDPQKNFFTYPPRKVSELPVPPSISIATN